LVKACHVISLGFPLCRRRRRRRPFSLLLTSVMNSSLDSGSHLLKYTYVALTYTKYQTFLGLKTENDRLRKQLEENSRFKPIVDPQNLLQLKEENQNLRKQLEELKATAVNKTENENLATSAETKTGDGSVNIDLIVARVLEKLGNNNKIGSGSDGLIADIPDPLPPEKSSPNLAANENLLSGTPDADVGTTEDSNNGTSDGSDLNSVDERLLTSVPPFRRPKAKTLLNSLKQHSDIIRFDSGGTIYLNDEPLDNSNIYNLFPLLFKPAQYSKHPHLQDLVNEIATVGLGHLISRFYSAGITPRGQTNIPERSKIHRELKSLGHHWYKMSDD